MDGVLGNYASQPPGEARLRSEPRAFLRPAGAVRVAIRGSQ